MASGIQRVTAEHAVAWPSANPDEDMPSACSTCNAVNTRGNPSVAPMPHIQTDAPDCRKRPVTQEPLPTSAIDPEEEMPLRNS